LNILRQFGVTFVASASYFAYVTYVPYVANRCLSNKKGSPKAAFGYSQEWGC
jgi:hypothetical protein